MNNSICFRTWGQYALFTDPVTRLGGEKCSYHVPTYEALKGIVKSIYWKPTITWVVDKVKVLKPFHTRTKGVKPLNFVGGGNSLAIYTYLVDVEYVVQAHFEWNLHRPELASDRIDGKHYEIARRMLERGGRQDIFLGARECQGYVEPCSFGQPEGHFAGIPELSFGLMFHGFDYPDETGRDEMTARFWHPVMREGIIDFKPPEKCEIRKIIRPMKAKVFTPRDNLRPVGEEVLS